LRASDQARRVGEDRIRAATFYDLHRQEIRQRMHAYTGMHNLEAGCVLQFESETDLRAQAKRARRDALGRQERSSSRRQEGRRDRRVAEDALLIARTGPAIMSGTIKCPAVRRRIGTDLGPAARHLPQDVVVLNTQLLAEPMQQLGAWPTAT
jgi:hypothetical protein